MVKPKRLRRGDKVAVVSLSWGGLGDSNLIHKWWIAKERLEQEFGLEAVCMPHALKGSGFVAEHPERRAKDLMDAFSDPSVSAVFCAIGGDDTIRTLPYIDFEVLRNNPKIFMGFSDSTINHLMMYKAGLVSFYGPSVMCDFGEYVEMLAYTKKAVWDLLFSGWDTYRILPSGEWTDDYIAWQESNRHIPYTMKPDAHGYEVLGGQGIVRGHLLGGCLDVFMMANGTSLWPTLAEWRDAVLFVETSEEKPSPEFVTWTFRNLAAQGILKAVRGILVGKPQGEQYYEEYKAAILQVVVNEEGLRDLPVFYNLNFGHAKPIGVLPYGIPVELNVREKTVTLLECPTV